MFKLDYNSRLPIYQQLKGSIVELVLRGVLEPGEQLPSVRAVAKDLGVNPNTVQKAYQELEYEGVLLSVSGKGNFVAQSEQLTEQMHRLLEKRLRDTLLDAKQAGVTLTRVENIAGQVYEEEKQ